MSQRAANTGLSLILVAILVTSGTLIPLFGSNIAYAKTTPSSRPDIEINILMSEQEFENEEGGLDIKWDHVTDETYDELASDLRNLPMVFDVIAVPAAQHFLEQHRSELAGRYVDTLFVRYRPYNTEIFVSIWYSLGLYQNMIASRLPEQYALKVADEVQFKISILKQFPAEDENYQEWIDFNILKYNLLPISSDRVAYLSGNLHDLYLQNKATLMKEDTSPALPYGEPVIMQTISAVMFEEMSRLDIHYMDRPIGMYDGRITRYDMGYLDPIYAGQKGAETTPTSEQIQRCEELGIDEQKCSDSAILQRIPRHAAIDVEEMAKEDAIVSSILVMVGIGAAGAGAAAVITLRRLRK